MRDGRCHMCHDACGMHVGLMMDAHVTYHDPHSYMATTITRYYQVDPP